jgi:crossover junction endodeoxyribonuclease RuvC
MADSSTYRVLGIDPGLHTTGYGAIEMRGRDVVLLEAGIIQTDPKAPMPARLVRLFDDIAALLADIKPDLAAIEKLYSHYAHPRTSILMGHARGVLLLACEQAGVGVRDMPATMVKRSICGNGHASKGQVQHAVQTLCNLSALPEPPDVADAIAIALCAGKMSTDYAF